MIDFSTKDYPGFQSAALDVCVEGTFGNFGRRIDIFLGDTHVDLTHYEWGIRLHGGPVLREKYLRARPMFGAEPFKPLANPQKLLDFVQTSILDNFATDTEAFNKLLADVRENGKRDGMMMARAQVREALGIKS